MGGCLQFLLLSWPEETKQGGKRLRGSCLPARPLPSQAFLKSARPETATAAVAGGLGRSEDGHDEVCEMGRGWFLGEDGTPCPSLPCPDHCPTLPGLGWWAPLESNLQSDTHTQRGRVWGRAPKKGKKRPFQEKSRSNCER